jgi:hypothetical protein
VNRKFLFAFGIISSVLILFSACTKDVGKPIPAAAPVVTVVDSCKTNVKFSKDIQPILRTYCTINSGCHADPPPSLGKNFTTYDRFQPYSNDALQFVLDTFMPLSNTTGPKRLSQCEITKLKTWVNEGSQNN